MSSSESEENSEICFWEAKKESRLWRSSSLFFEEIDSSLFVFLSPTMEVRSSIVSCIDAACWVGEDKIFEFLTVSNGFSFEPNMDLVGARRAGPFDRV